VRAVFEWIAYYGCGHDAGEQRIDKALLYYVFIISQLLVSFSSVHNFILKSRAVHILWSCNTNRMNGYQDAQSSSILDGPGQPPSVQGGQGQAGAARGHRYACDPNLSYTLDVAQTVLVFLEYGLVRSNRRIGKYCEKGRLLCCKNPDSEVWKVNRESVVQLIGEIKQTGKQDVMIDEDTASATSDLPLAAAIAPGPSGAAQGGLGLPAADPIIETLRDVVITLKDQLKEKDQQIARLFNQQERSDVLLHNLQNKMDTLLQIQAPRTTNVDGVRPIEREQQHTEYPPYTRIGMTDDRGVQSPPTATPPAPRQPFDVPFREIREQSSEERV
jgi:hypothetical protein